MNNEKAFTQEAWDHEVSPWKRDGPYEGWKPFFRSNTPNVATFSPTEVRRMSAFEWFVYVAVFR